MGLQFDAIYSYTASTNAASIATAASVGMRKEKEYLDETDTPTYVSSITRSVWSDKNATA